MSLPSRLLATNPGIQVSTLLSGSLVTPSAKGRFLPPEAGYVYGGYRYDAASMSTSIQKLLFANETTSVLSASIIAVQVFYGGSATNSGVAGYALNTGTGYTGVEKLTYSTQTNSSVSTTVNAGTANVASMNNSGSAAYSAGGYEGGNTNRVGKLNYSTETGSLLGTTLSDSRRETVGMGNRGTKGYSLGGYSGGWGNYAQGFPFSTETMGSVSFTLPSAGGSFGTANRDQVAGYGFGDQNVTDYASRIIKVTFSGETLSTLSATILSGSAASGISNSSVAIYRAGGWNTSTSTIYTTIGKLSLPGETASTISSSLTTGTATASTMSNEGVL